MHHVFLLLQWRPLARAAALVGPLGAVMAATACVAWQPSSVGALGEPHPERAKYQVWVGGKSHYLHAVRTTPDSLFGVPNYQAPDCTRCVVSFALRSIDSVRTLKEGQTAGRNVMWITLLAVGVLIAVGLATVGGLPAY